MVMNRAPVEAAVFTELFVEAGLFRGSPASSFLSEVGVSSDGFKEGSFASVGSFFSGCSSVGLRSSRGLSSSACLASSSAAAAERSVASAVRMATAQVCRALISSSFDHDFSELLNNIWLFKVQTVQFFTRNITD